ncbi:MAG: hypothetical protein HOL58_02925 [Francisellaceae bacterium]|nr:hypothetical protein [Francisellaceae bacterium]
MLENFLETLREGTIETLATLTQKEKDIVMDIISEVKTLDGTELDSKSITKILDEFATRKNEYTLSYQTNMFSTLSTSSANDLTYLLRMFFDVSMQLRIISDYEGLSRILHIGEDEEASLSCSIAHTYANSMYACEAQQNAYLSFWNLCHSFAHHCSKMSSVKNYISIFENKLSTTEIGLSSKFIKNIAVAFREVLFGTHVSCTGVPLIYYMNRISAQLCSLPDYKLNTNFMSCHKEIIHLQFSMAVISQHRFARFTNIYDLVDPSAMALHMNSFTDGNNLYLKYLKKENIQLKKTLDMYSMLGASLKKPLTLLMHDINHPENDSVVAEILNITLHENDPYREEFSSVMILLLHRINSLLRIYQYSFSKEKQEYAKFGIETILSDMSPIFFLSKIKLILQYGKDLLNGLTPDMFLYMGHDISVLHPSIYPQYHYHDASQASHNIEHLQKFINLIPDEPSVELAISYIHSIFVVAANQLGESLSLLNTVYLEQVYIAAIDDNAPLNLHIAANKSSKTLAQAEIEIMGIFSNHHQISKTSEIFGGSELRTIMHQASISVKNRLFNFKKNIMISKHMHHIACTLLDSEHKLVIMLKEHNATSVKFLGYFKTTMLKAMPHSTTYSFGSLSYTSTTQQRNNKIHAKLQQINLESHDESIEALITIEQLITDSISTKISNKSECLDMAEHIDIDKTKNTGKTYRHMPHQI